MSRRVIACVAGALICFLYGARGQETSTAEAERYIKESERLWAESVANGDSLGGRTNSSRGLYRCRPGRRFLRQGEDGFGDTRSSQRVHFQSSQRSESSLL